MNRETHNGPTDDTQARGTPYSGDPDGGADTQPGPLDKLPLDAWHRARGGRMVPFAGYEMPVQYEGIMAEHLWTRENAGLFDVSHMGQLLIHGQDADIQLEKVLPADLRGAKDMKPKYSLLMADNGGIIDDLMATRRGQDFYVVVNGATKHGDIAYLERKLPGVHIDYMRQQALLALQGPRAAEVLETIVPGVSDLGFMEAGPFRALGQPLWISRSGYTGEDGFEISIPAIAAAELADAIVANPLAKPIGLGARDSLRLEAGLCLYGNDIDELTTPVEAGLTWVIGKRRKMEWDFPGSLAIRDHLDNGTPRCRVGIRPDGRTPARALTTIMADDGTEAGVVTSGGFGPTVNGPVAMGYVRRDLAVDGARVSLIVRGKAVPATVVPLPFVPHRYIRR
jgi:aminomethyltransferase